MGHVRFVALNLGSIANTTFPYQKLLATATICLTKRFYPFEYRRVIAGEAITTYVTESLLTLDELSEYLKVSKSSLYKLAQAGKVPGNKIGKHWRFRKATIDQWIDGNQGESKKLNNE